MSAKEPLLGTLKVCILNLQGSSSPYTDTSPHLQSFCEVLEMILRKGIKQPVLGFKRKDYWHWLEQLPQVTHPSMTLLSMMIEKTNSCEKVLTAQGRGRYFLRLALNRKLLAVAVKQLIRSSRLLEWYDPMTSILGNEDLSEPFLSLMLVVTEMNFSLDLQNSSFLDESWQLPVCLTYETVPCRELGMVLRYLDGRIFIVNVLPQSQAAVDEVVLVGDVIDEINGSSLRNACNGQAGTVLQKYKGKPLSFRLIRWKWHDGGMYKPLLPYLKILQEKIPSFQLQHEHTHKEKKEDRCLQGGRLLYNLRYLGHVNVGKYGSKEVLDQGIPMVLEKHLPRQEVLFDVKETEVVVQEKAASKVLFRYSYTDISCVGRRLDSNNLFAFCSVVSPESSEQSTFDCLVFESNTEDESEEIIRRIAAGFKHTEWFV
ncbi:XP_028572750.1uncharacterized protein LOC114590625 isoform X2 [Podarcis lilfordi]|uniref:XP_028572750.1uncharacterized protein LOC114590625 isoform X2 n=2 Tax=Podarcis lilfordi TaxID=74358 RepID=A0AA35JVR7_9SAUR|nr:XP_028572750.1uncharacterized protein LOC114590625 isoform X2 [Podarcis lilfordi]